MDVVTCNGCTFIFAEPRRVPKALPCGHTYCKKCMDQLVEIDNHLCPYCRQPWGEKVDDLVTNLTLLEIAQQPQFLDKAMEADIEDEVFCVEREMDMIQSQLAAGNIDPVAGLAKIKDLKQRCTIVMDQETKRKERLLAEEKKTRQALAILENIQRNLDLP